MNLRPYLAPWLMLTIFLPYCRLCGLVTCDWWSAFAPLWVPASVMLLRIVFAASCHPRRLVKAGMVLLCLDAEIKNDLPNNGY